MSDAYSVLEILHPHKKGIITNGTIRYQNAKIDKIGIRHYFDCEVINKEVGAAKPARIILISLECSLDAPQKNVFSSEIHGKMMLLEVHTPICNRCGLIDINIRSHNHWITFR
jgi:hypothetical protein